MKHRYLVLYTLAPTPSTSTTRRSYPPPAPIGCTLLASPNCGARSARTPSGGWNCPFPRSGRIFDRELPSERRLFLHPQFGDGAPPWISRVRLHEIFIVPRLPRTARLRYNRRFSGGGGRLWANSVWFCRNDDEWAAFAERLKLMPSTHWLPVAHRPNHLSGHRAPSLDRPQSNCRSPLRPQHRRHGRTCSTPDQLDLPTPRQSPTGSPASPCRPKSPFGSSRTPR